jgi:hypothetical protein
VCAPISSSERSSATYSPSESDMVGVVCAWGRGPGKAEGNVVAVVGEISLKKRAARKAAFPQRVSDNARVPSPANYDCCSVWKWQLMFLPIISNCVQEINRLFPPRCGSLAAG